MMIVIPAVPVCGITQYSGTGKSICVALSPVTDRVVDSNVGGHFGPHLKFAVLTPLNYRGLPGESNHLY
jgi:aldehyde:ferredoxin oxidoreductase